ncbi:oxalate/formate MFS antiporter [Rosenbergiella australiborealis]|uniref:Oxalate/formate MFS antiporter n=1 Tax=Rosenbergiella australiborealis TaxID=1544696 RepID=A0ABS5T570_9GAMM|nr:oxalate/formate MFS antiporter [Rosenbergiella australiborealis]MBT0727491.1 oxalate/formate MFS antiporter [Rosenbergiella australiborealis]
MSVQTEINLSQVVVRQSQKWQQLALGLLCMASISSPQYVWTLLTKPLLARLDVHLPVLQVTFSLLIIFQTFLSPLQGKLIDRFGAQRFIGIGTLLTGASWIGAAYSQSIWSLYLLYGVVGGLGTGIVYIGVVGQVMRWFPQQRGFAAGMVAAGYGMGAIITTLPIANSLASHGLTQTLVEFGVGFALVGWFASRGLRPAPNTDPIPSATLTTGRHYTPSKMLKHPLFWLLFFMMACMSTSGLMVTSQLAGFASEVGVSQVVIWGMAALPLAMSLDRLTNGLTRPLFGWVSDRIGRENTMFVAFALEAAAMTLWLTFRHDPLLFIVLSGVVFLGWGEIFSLFPATLTDTFGSQHATSNYGWLYMSQGVGSILGGPLAALLYQTSHGWVPVFSVAIGLDILTALLAVVILKPWRKRFLQH